MDAKLRIVLVEDCEVDAALLARRLFRSDIEHQLTRVETEADFARTLDSATPDLIISDFSLPQFNGMRALEIALERLPDTPFIFVSGTIGEKRAMEALKRGAADCVLKSDLDRLPCAIERALRAKALNDESRAGRSRPEHPGL